MHLSSDHLLPPQKPTEPAFMLEDLRYLRTNAPEILRALEEAASEQIPLPIQIAGYKHQSTRRLVMALLRCAYTHHVSVLLAPIDSQVDSHIG